MNLPALLIVFSILLALPVRSQGLALDTQAYGTSTSLNPAYAADFQLHCVQTTAKSADLVVSGGTPGFDVSLIVGLNKIQATVLGAELLTTPVLFFSIGKVDAQGRTRFSFPMPASKGKYFYAQAMQVGAVQQLLVVAMSEGLRVETIAAQPSSMSFSRSRATTMMQLAFDVYEWKSGNGPIKVGQRLTGGYRVLRKFKSPNPPSSAGWFSKLGWPDTQLMVARNASGDIAVVFRGTDPSKAKDWVTDVMFAPANGFHGGFLLAYSSVAVELDNFLQQHVDKHAKVYFTGHSLGGALAPVAAYHLQPRMASLGVDKNDVITYAFAGPRAMTPTKAKEFAQRIPHHYLVENKDDMVTHVPTPLQGFEHIPNVQVLYPRGAKVAMAGKDYRSHGVPTPVPHTQETYLDRIKGYLGMPSVSLSVSSGGFMQMRRSWAGQAAWGLDTVRLYQGDPRTTGALRYSALASLGSLLNTTWAKDTGYYVAYVQSFATENLVLAVMGPYTWAAPKLSMSKTTLGFVKINWTMKDPGAHDYIALYNKDPRKATLLNRLGTIQATDSSRSWATIWRWKSGLWAAYVQRGNLTQAGTFTKIVGPTK